MKYALSSTNVYFASYFYYKGEDINTTDTYFLMPSLDLLILLFYTPGAKLGLKIGTTYSILLMLLFHFISFIILIFGNKFYLLLIALSLLGIGSGLSNITYMRNCWKFFPQNQGLVNGVVISSSGIVSTLLTILADFVIINPNKEETNNGIYPRYVADNVNKFSIIIAAILGSFDIIGLILTFDFEKLPETIEEKMRKINENRKESLSTIDINLSVESTDLKLSMEKQKVYNEINLKKALFSLTNFKLMIFCFTGYCKLFYIL